MFTSFLGLGGLRSPTDIAEEPIKKVPYRYNVDMGDIEPART